MSREDELLCLNNLRKAFFEKPISKVAFDNTEGMVRKLLISCVPNPSKNDFPDFIFDGGALEHFLVGSSKEGKKGARFYCEQHKERVAFSNYVEEQRKVFESSPPAPGTYETAIYETHYEDFSYESFLASLDRNISKHVNSLNKCRASFGTVVFLMEQQTPRLNIFKYGRFARFYLLSQDKCALDILAKYADKVNYIIYYAFDVIEAIDLSKLSEMQARSTYYDDIRGGKLTKIDMLLKVDV